MDAEMNRKLSAVSPEEVETDTVKQEYGERMKKENGFENFKGNDPKIQHIRELGQRIARTDFPVLITGETGTGKEVIARAIHMESGRSEEPFVAINCAAIPESMLEAVLFGYEKGAFTGAMKSMPGKFEQANKGTIFLDEIGEMKIELQAKLLRVLQEREVERLGSEKSMSLDIRVLSASNVDMPTAIANNEFREDLFYRLNVFPLHLPPLRERPKDISAIVNKLLERHCQHKRTLPEVTDEAMEKLLAHTWPGNIRELDNVIQRALVMMSGNKIELQDLILDQK